MNSGLISQDFRLVDFPSPRISPISYQSRVGSILRYGLSKILIVVQVFCCLSTLGQISSALCNLNLYRLRVFYSLSSSSSFLCNYATCDKLHLHFLYSSLHAASHSFTPCPVSATSSILISISLSALPVWAPLRLLLEKFV